MIKKFLMLSISLMLLANLGQATEEPVQVAGFDKAFYLQSPDENFRLNIDGYIQGQVNANFIEGAADTNNIRVRRLRMKFYGHVFTEKVKYLLEYDFAASRFLTGYIELEHNNALSFRIGQYKVPFDFEGWTSASSLQFVDRSLAHAFFGIGNEREVGFGFQGKLMDNKFEYGIGAFNGEGFNNANANNEFRYAGRLVYNIKGEHGYKFSDTKISETPHLAVAAGAMFNDTPNAAATGENKVTSLVGETFGKYQGIGYLASFYLRSTNPEGAVGATTDMGALAQIGYMFTEKLEAAGRVSQIFLDGAGDRGEYTAGINYYIYGDHKVKMQFDYSALYTEDGIAVGDDQLNHRIRAQLQVKI